MNKKYYYYAVILLDDTTKGGDKACIDILRSDVKLSRKTIKKNGYITVTLSRYGDSDKVWCRDAIELSSSSSWEKRDYMEWEDAVNYQSYHTDKGRRKKFGRTCPC